MIAPDGEAGGGVYFFRRQFASIQHAAMAAAREILCPQFW